MSSRSNLCPAKDFAKDLILKGQNYWKMYQIDLTNMRGKNEKIIKNKKLYNSSEIGEKVLVLAERIKKISTWKIL